jgi:hypothetical protein
MKPLMNLTIQVPPGATQHNNPHTLCIRGPPWKDVLSVITFFATNYIAHAATVKSTPGEGAVVTVCNIFLALCFPMFGLLRALNAIARGARFGGSELKNACRAGALCMVVRSPDWRPDPGQQLEATIIEDEVSEEERGYTMETHSDPIDAKMINYFPPYAREDSSAWAYFDTIGSRAYVHPDLTRIHGTYFLSKGYTFAIVPRNTRLNDTKEASTASATGKDKESTQIAGVVNQPTRNRDNDAASARTIVAANGPARNESNDTMAAIGPTAGNDTSSGRTINGPAPTTTNEKTTAHTAKCDISASYNAVKAIASLIQMLAAINTLLLHRSDVIERWGYASFHLTVIPYLVMTVVNFVSNVLVADYACLYMVESELMREARNKGSVFIGTVAAVEEFQGQLPQVSSESEVFVWGGFTQRHIRSVVALLTGNYSDVTIDMRRRKRRVSNIHLTCLDTTESSDDAFNHTVDPDEQDRTMSNDAVQRSPGSGSDGREVASHQAAAPASSNRSAYGESAERSAPEEVATDRDRSRLGLRIPPVSRHENRPRQDSLRPDGDSEAAGRLADTIVTLQRVTGQRYRIQQQRPARMLDTKLFPRTYREQHRPPARTPDFKFLPYLKTRLDSLYQLLGTYDPMRLRLLESIIYVRQNSTGNEDWKTRLLMLYRYVYGDILPKFNRRRAQKPTIYFPNCICFVRDGEDTGRPPKGRGNAGVMMVLEVVLGCAILGLVVVLIAWLSHWFSHGQSTRTERAIIMLWMCEGAFGLLLPLVSVKELIMVFLLLPVYATFLYVGTGQASLLYAIAFIPVGIFIAPIWGFVIIGQMLVQWGNCVNLY